MSISKRKKSAGKRGSLHRMYDDAMAEMRRLSEGEETCRRELATTLGRRIDRLEERLLGDPLACRVVVSGFIAEKDRFSIQQFDAKGRPKKPKAVKPKKKPVETRHYFGKVGQITRLGMTTLCPEVWCRLEKIRLEVPTPDVLIGEVVIGQRSICSETGLKSVEIEGEINVGERVQVTLIHEPQAKP